MWWTGDKRRVVLLLCTMKQILGYRYQSEISNQWTYADSIKMYYGEEYTMASKYHTIVPIIFGGNRIATLLLARAEKAYDDEDIAICEYGATVVGIEVARGIAMDEEEDIRMKEAVDMALSTLSYSEMDAVTKIFC